MIFTFLISALLLASPMVAQPVIIAAELIPPLGPSPVRDFCGYIPAGPATANFTFDATSLVSSQQFQYQYLDPYSTPFVPYFPQATHSYTDLNNPNAFVYTQATSTEMHYLGLRYLSGPFDDHTDPQKWYKLPMTYNLSFTDQWTGNGQDFQAQTYTRAGTTTVTYNGYGTVMLPGGTYTDRARIETNEVYTDTYGMALYHYSHNTVEYHKPGSPAPIFTSVARLGVISVGYDTLQTFSYALKGPALGMHTLQTPDIVARLYPNPATDHATVQLVETPNSAVTMTLMDATGRIVRLLAAATSPISQYFDVDVSDLQAGTYFIRLSDTDGRTGTIPLVVD